MYIQIHSQDLSTTSAGKKTKAESEGEITYEQVVLSNGNAGLKVSFECSDYFVKGVRSDGELARMMQRTVSLLLDPSDIAGLAAALIKWTGPAVPHDTAIELIEKLAKDLRSTPPE